MFGSNNIFAGKTRRAWQKAWTNNMINDEQAQRPYWYSDSHDMLVDVIEGDKTRKCFHHEMSNDLSRDEIVWGCWHCSVAFVFLTKTHVTMSMTFCHTGMINHEKIDFKSVRACSFDLIMLCVKKMYKYCQRVNIKSKKILQIMITLCSHYLFQ